MLVVCGLAMPEFDLCTWPYSESDLETIHTLIGTQMQVLSGGIATTSKETQNREVQTEKISSQHQLAAPHLHSCFIDIYLHTMLVVALQAFWRALLQLVSSIYMVCLLGRHDWRAG